MSELGGYLQEQDLIREMAISMDDAGSVWLKRCWANGHLGMRDEMIPKSVFAEAALSVLRRRQCLSDIGLEQVKLNEQRLTQSQTE